MGRAFRPLIIQASYNQGFAADAPRRQIVVGHLFHGLNGAHGGAPSLSLPNNLTTKVLLPTLRVGKLSLTTFSTDNDGAHGGAPSLSLHNNLTTKVLPPTLRVGKWPLTTFPTGSTARTEARLPAPDPKYDMTK